MRTLTDYIETHCERDRGVLLPLLEFANGFRHGMPPDERAVWPRRRVVYELNHAGIQTARSVSDGRHFVVGLCWRPECDPRRDTRATCVQGSQGSQDASPQNQGRQSPEGAHAG